MGKVNYEKYLDGREEIQFLTKMLNEFGFYPVYKLDTPEGTETVTFDKANRVDLFDRESRLKRIYRKQGTADWTFTEV